MEANRNVAMIATNLERTGISTVVMNYCREIDKTKFDMSILAGKPIAEEYRKECTELGVRIVELPARKTDSLHYYMELNRELKKNQYDIVHIHGNSATITMELAIAWMNGVKTRIAHSHNTTCSNMMAHKLLYPLFQKLCTQGVACSKAAGEWLFHSRLYEVLPNGFHTERFEYDEDARTVIRKQLNMDDRFVIGHVGRFNHQKNHAYLLKIFEAVAAKEPKAVLLLVGNGPDYEKIKTLVDEHPYKDRIILYGETKCIAMMYSAMDVFVLPSCFEGLPVVLLEAQISGLPCIVSDRVTKEADFGEIVWKSIDDDPGVWEEEILGQYGKKVDRKKYAITHQKNMKQYDIDVNVKQLEKLYEDCSTNVHI